MAEDWTWVLERPCPQCGYDADEFGPDELGGRIRAVAAAWRDMLGRGAVLHVSPDDGDRTWSILEYGCHVRDVFELLETRLRLMLKKRKPPTYSMWDPEAAAADGDYAGADPAKVAYALASNAGKAADVIDRVHGDDWDRRGIRGDGTEFSIDSLTRYLLHDAEHHLWDANEIVAAQQ